MHCGYDKCGWSRGNSEGWLGDSGCGQMSPSYSVSANTSIVVTAACWACDSTIAWTGTLGGPLHVTPLCGVDSFAAVDADGITSTSSGMVAAADGGGRWRQNSEVFDDIVPTQHP